MQARGLPALLALAVLAGAGLTSGADAQAADRGAGGLRWDRVWSDGFGGPAGSRPNPRKWTYDIGGWGWGNGQQQTNTSDPANVRMDGNGNLLITARRETHTGPDGITRQYTSGRLKTEGIFAVRYGRIAARVRVPVGQGIWPTFWMLGNDIRRVGFPECGEIDLMELRGDQPNILYGTVHGPGPEGENIGPGAILDYGRSLATRFHVYEVRWTRRAVRFRMDGRKYGAVWRQYYPEGADWVYDHRMFLLLNLAVGGEWPGPPDSSTPFPAKLKADWVRVWKPRH
jgi:beta-glucanase (GH16 family)